MTLRSFSLLPDPVKEDIQEKPVTNRGINNISKTLDQLFPKIRVPKTHPREIVAGGDIRWKPVDLNAAKLLMKSPEINKAPPTMKNTHQVSGVIDKGVPGVDRELNGSELNASIAGKVIAKTKSTEERIVTLANDAAQAKALLEEIATTMRADVMEFQDELPAAIKAIRTWRMAITQERDLALSALTDLRKFFLGSDHEKEMGRLENFIRTCERLRSLSQDGTLEKVADVMLKLA